MQYVIIFFTFIAELILLWYVYFWVFVYPKYKDSISILFGEKKKKKTVRDNVLIKPNSHLYFGSALTVFSLAGLTLVWLFPGSINPDPARFWIIRITFLVVFEAAPLISGLLLVLSRLNWKVEFFRDRLYVRNIFRFEKEYLYDELEERESRIFHFLNYYIGNRRVFFLTYLETNCDALQLSFHSWKNKKRGKGQPDTKTTARIPKDILRLLRECGWDSLTEVLQGKLWGYEKAKEGELFSSYFSLSEFISVLEKMEWEFYCKYNETLFYMGHEGKKVTGGYYFSVYTEDSDDEDESPQYFKSARELLNSATVEGKSIVSLWDELMVTEE